MDYRIIERCYGPDVRFNDWKNEGGELVSAGGGVQIFADEPAVVTRSDCRYGGGGDVEIVFRFNFEHMGENGAFAAHFNGSTREPEGGFRVILDGRHTSVYHKTREIFRGDAPPPDREHTLRFATLAESYTVCFDDRCLAEGRMDPPFTENEGWMIFRVQNAGVRILSFEENFIAHPVAFPQWKRADLLYEEPFGEASFTHNWVCNGERPEVRPGACTFRHMGNSILKQRLEAPLAVEFIARPEPSEKHTAGISDAIFIWMIDKPGGDLFDHMQSLPDAALTHYLPLPLYWVDFGGTNNVTTRFRKNPGRHLIRQFTDRARLLDRNRSYSITIVQNNAIAEFWVDGECWIQTCDPNPLTSGYIGFRAFVADLTVRDLKIWRIESQ